MIIDAENEPTCHVPAASSSFSCILRLAASIISSLLLCSICCRKSLLGAQPDGGDSPAFSLPFELILEWRLYLVIRSGSAGLRSAKVGVEVEDKMGNGTSGWNDGGACHGGVNESFQLRNGRGLTYRLEAPASEYSFCCGSNTSAIAL